MRNADFANRVPASQLHRSLIKAVGREDVQIRGEPKIQKATASIEGFTSVVLRVEVSYGFSGDETTTSTKLFIVKCLPNTDYQLKLARTCNFFERESRFFDEVVPIMQKVSNGKVEIPLPSCYHVVYEKDAESLYMEDLAEGDFRTPARIYHTDGLDLPHCLVAMKCLGKLHALLIAAEKTIPPGKGDWTSMIPVFSKDAIYFESLPGEPITPLIGMIENAMGNILYFAKHLDGLPKEAEASGKLEKISKRTWNTLIRLLKPNSEGRNVLNHGDCWLNNMMFRYDNDSSGKQIPRDAKFIDFQIVRNCSPSIDLLHFIYMSTTKPFRDRYLDQMIGDYYKSMEQTLKNMNISPPPFTIEELKTDFHGQYKPYGVIIGMIFGMGLRLGDDVFLAPNEELTSEKFVELFETDKVGSMMRNHFAKDPEYRTKVEDTVSEFVDMAFPDGLDNMDSSPMLL